MEKKLQEIIKLLFYAKGEVLYDKFSAEAKLEKAIKELKSLLSEQGNERKDEWINVDKELPELEKTVIVAAKYGNRLIVLEDTAYYSKGKWIDSANDFDMVDGLIKFWQPLPKPPSLRDEEKDNSINK